MQKNKRPSAAKPKESTEDKDDALAQALCDLAIELLEQEDSDSMHDSLKQKQSDFDKLIKKCLRQKEDDILYEALERSKYADEHAHQFLKGHIDEASEILIVRRDEGKTLEMNAFVIPMFVRTIGGLNAQQCFQDQDAFDRLTKSLQEGKLESQDAQVVLVSHAYHLDEIDRITYSDLAEILRDVLASMTEKKVRATPALERSFSGWPENNFAPMDEVVELRFLLGFALKATDDSFYLVPEDEAAIDAYFAQREEYFQQWTEHMRPLVARCLVAVDRRIDVNFLYQDLFHGGKERGIAEHFMLQMMSALNHGLSEKGIMPDDVKAIVGPVDVDGEIAIKVVLTMKADGTQIASYEKSVSGGQDLQSELDDVFDALGTLGMTSLFFAAGFDDSGVPINIRLYEF